MKKFEGIGRNLNATEMKLVMGGNEEEEVPGDGGGSGNCGSDCSGTCTIEGCGSGNCSRSRTSGNCRCAAICG